MAVTADRVVVGATAVALNVADPAVTTIVVRNGNWVGSDNVMLGPNTVTATSGFDLRAGETVTLTLKANDVLYAIAGAAVESVLVSVVRATA